MPGTFTSLEIGRSALYVNQRALETSAHNISNANTPGFSRQALRVESIPGANMPGLTNDIGTMLMGGGVKLNTVIRIRDSFLDSEFRGSSRRSGALEMESQTLRQTENIFNEPGNSGVSDTLSAFWNAWQEVGRNPESTATRSVLKVQAQNVAERFRTLSSNLGSVLSDLTQQIDNRVAAINAMAPQLADLNKQITSVQALGFPANDLLDKRDYLLDQLAKLTDYVLATDENGAVSVSVGSTLLVFGNQYRQLTDSSDIRSGEIGGLKDAEASVQQLLADVNTLAGQIITSVNALHQTGYDLDGNPGGLFFNGSDAATIGLDPAISSDLRKIAASSQAGVVGDGSIAREIGNLKRQLIMNGGTVSFDDYYNGLVTNLGVAAKNAENSFEVENLVLEQIENQRSSVSGVSLDDEMVNLTQYQRSYEAAARFVTVADSLLDTLINRTGVI